MNPEILLTLILVFIAVAWGVWSIVPVLIGIGTERVERDSSASNDLVYRLTPRKKIVRQSWTLAVASGGIAGAIALAARLQNAYILIGIMVLIGMITYRFPLMFAKLKAQKRHEAFEDNLLDLTMGLTNALRAGSSFPAALSSVSRELGGVVGEEMQVVLQEVRVGGMEMTKALERLCKRVPSEDLLLLMTAVRLSMQAGGSLAEVLEKISVTIRRRKEFQQKLKTMTAAGRFEAIAMALAPVAVFTLMYLVDSKLMTLLFTRTLGWCAIGAVVTLEIVGFLVIRKIVTIEV